MKLLLLLIGLFFMRFSFGQVSDTAVARSFWNDNIQAVLKSDVPKVLSQTHFPLEVHKGMKSEKWTKEQFKARFKEVFTQRVMEELRAADVNSIDAWVMGEDATETYMLVCMLSDEDTSAVVLSFKQFNGKWQLYFIDYHLE